jgi:glycosyltransferase involved in cell wall biosynthesis
VIVLFDSKEGRGGGQVVLESLLRRFVDSATPVTVVMPTAGQKAISIPAPVITFNTEEEFLSASTTSEGYLLVSNANSSLPAVIRVAKALRNKRTTVHTAAIVHNYAEKLVNRVATRVLLQKIDIPIAVEPGLAAMRKDIIIPPWLSLESTPSTLPNTIARTGKVKSFARPDHSKGLHLLPAIFRLLEENGYTGEVAVGHGLQQQSSYKSQLERDLKPWAVSGSRTAAWIDPGDIFLVPSVSGEAVCLAAQEAMAQGAFVVASRVGLLSYMSPTSTGIRTFEVGDTSSAASTIVDALTMDESEFLAECHGGNAQIRGRAGLWYEYVVRLLAAADREVPTATRA